MTAHARAITFIEIDPKTTDAQADEYRKAGVKDLVAFNNLTAIGGLIYVKDAEPHHKHIASRFKSFYEALYGNGLGASDTAREPVDTSIQAHDNGMAAALDRSRDLAAAREGISKEHWNAVLSCIVLCIAPKNHVDDGLMSEWNLRKAGKAHSRVVLDGLDAIGKIWGL